MISLGGMGDVSVTIESQRDDRRRDVFIRVIDTNKNDPLCAIKHHGSSSRC